MNLENFHLDLESWRFLQGYAIRSLDWKVLQKPKKNEKLWLLGIQRKEKLISLSTNIIKSVLKGKETQPGTKKAQTEVIQWNEKNKECS